MLYLTSLLSQPKLKSVIILSIEERQHIDSGIMIIPLV